jgi:hypothetical protein
MDWNYWYRAVIIDGVRCDVIAGSVNRMRDGGTTHSTFQWDGKTFNLFQPTPFSRMPAELTQK